jgi:hypothetical protein
MHPTRYAPRPETGELTNGQPVIVYRSPNDMRGRKPEDRAIPARIVKANRVWIELERADLAESQIGHRTWRMRRDTQDEGTQYSGSNDRFVTVPQHEWEETLSWARGFLRENGIDLRTGGKWYGREVELADIISAATDRTEPL